MLIKNKLIVCSEDDIIFNIMKNIFLLLFTVFVVNVSFSQQTSNIEPTEMCIPYDVAQKILLDLNEYDKLKELSKLDKNEIIELNNKINLLQKTNQFWQEKDSLNNELFHKAEEKFKISEEENKDLRKENKKLKIKNSLFNIVSLAIITPLTYLTVFK
jgi:hypothetical protein